MSQDPAETNETLVSITGSFWIHIKNATRFIGFCFLDHQTFTLSLCQFQDDTSYTNLESLLVQIPLSECYGALQKKNESELIPLKKLMSRCQVVLHENILVNENEFDHMDSFKPFEFLLCPQDKPQQYSTSIQGMPYATKASYHLFYKTKLLQDSSQANQYFLKIVSNTQFVRLDTATLTALNIFPQNAQQKATPGNSLFGLLNTCRTLMGVTRLKMYLVQPLKNVNDICERQEIVKLFIQHADLKHILSSSFLRRLPNFDALSNKFHRALMKPLNATSICSLDDILHLYNGITDLYAILNLLVTLQEREPENSSKALTKQFIEPLQKSLHRFKRFNELVDYTFDPQERDNGRAVIHREFDITLKDLLEQKEHLLNSIEQHRCQVQSRLFSGDSKTSFDSQLVKLLECNMCEYVFRVKKKDQQILQKDKSRYQPVRINKMDFQFTTKELTSFCQDLHDVNEKLKAAQEELARKTILASSSYWSVIQLVGNLMGHLDVLLCFAHLATSASSKYVLPTFQQTNLETIQLTNARHPLLEVQYSLHHAQTKGANGVQSIVPNSVILQKPDSVVQLISGPNMGGKSTYLRQVGLLCLMAQVGCPIPCDCATMNPVDAIFCRVGASDDQKEGISTFYAEMIETAAILKAATRSSLILMDELGRGTSTSEGLALATHVTRYIACRLQCFCIFATHFQELSALEGSVPGIKCFQVDVHVHSNQLQFLFRIRPGHADRSYGIHVAELAQMDPTLIQRAQQIAKSLQDCERHTPRLDNYINALQNALHDVFQHSLSQSLPSSTSLENLKKILTDIDAE